MPETPETSAAVRAATETIVRHLAHAIETIKTALEAGDMYSADPPAVAVELEPIGEAVAEIRKAAALVESLELHRQVARLSEPLFPIKPADQRGLPEQTDIGSDRTDYELLGRVERKLGIVRDDD